MVLDSGQYLAAGRHRHLFNRDCGGIRGKGLYGNKKAPQIFYRSEMDKAYQNTPIGRPDQDTEIVLLDENGEKHPREGLMCIRLPYFRGYLHDEDRADFINVDGVSYFKSGDYMAVDEDGNYTILGRVDDI